MLKSISISPVVRAVLVIGAVAALVTGVTFAALSDTATLADNNLTSDTAELKVANNIGSGFVDSAPGFNASDVVPGVGKTFPFYLQNGSGFGMDVTVAVPGVCATYVNGSQGIPDCDAVLLTFKSLDPGNSGETTYTLQDLLDGPKTLPGNPLGAGVAGSDNGSDNAGDYSVKFDLDPDTVTGGSATLTAPFNLNFTGTQADDES